MASMSEEKLIQKSAAQLEGILRACILKCMAKYVPAVPLKCE